MTEWGGGGGLGCLTKVSCLYAEMLRWTVFSWVCGLIAKRPRLLDVV